MNWKKKGITNIYFKDKKIFSDNGYSKKDFVTYVIDLSKNDTDIWDGLNKSAKRDVARAKKLV